MWLKAFNIVGFQMVWLACVAGAGSGLIWVGPASAAIFAATTLRYGGKAAADLRLLAIALPLGFALDSAFATSGWLRYASAWPSPSVSPLWIWAMWTGFAMTLNHSLAFLRENPWLAAGFGLLGGPLAYWIAAGAFDAVSFAAPVSWVLIALAFSWALALPLLFALDRRMTMVLFRESIA
jgi:hypothetical protein